MTETTDPLRIPIGRNVTYAVRGMPEVANAYGPGYLVPTEISLTYRAAPDSQLGRVHAYVAGRLWADGAEIPLLPGGLYGQHYDDGLDGWPAWLAEEARLHDPDAAVLPAPVDRAAVLSDAERQFLTFALDQAADEMSLGDGFTDEDEAALEKLRRMADETPQPKTEAHPPHHRWYVETRDGLANQWAPGMRFTDHTHAVERYQAVSEHHATWKDGTPVQRRLVRETTSYTVEPAPELPAVGAQQPKEA